MIRIRIRHIIAALFILAIVALLFSLREFFFDSDDITIRIDAPEEIDVGSEEEIYVTLTNSTRRSLNNGKLFLETPESIVILGEENTTFSSLESRQQVTAKFIVRAEGEAGSTSELKARARFRPGPIFATLEKQITTTVRSRELPFDLSFSFPSDVSIGRPFTFFVRVQSRAGADIGPVGVELEVPETMKLLRSIPTTLPDTEYLWDLGDLRAGEREEITVTGRFDVDVSGGEFVARVGLFDETRKTLGASREVREFLNFRAGAVAVDLTFREQKNPGEAAVLPGEALEVELRYQNVTEAAMEDLSVLLAFAHDAIDPMSIRASETYKRSISGEYLWDSDSLFALRRLEPGASGEITFSAKLKSMLSFSSLSEANQTITVRARVMSGGRILGERQLLLKIGGKLSIDAAVFFFNAPGGSNSGPLPPRVGQKTTYTVTLTVAGGTTGLENVTTRIILGFGGDYEGLIEPTDAAVTYDTETREVAWDIGAMPPGAGLLSAPRTVSFRIGLVPLSEDVGKPADLLTSITVSGEDIFTGKILDAEDESVNTLLRDDVQVGDISGIVQP